MEELKEKIDYIFRFFKKREDESQTILKSENIELTADELLFLNTYAASKPLEDEEAVNVDLLEMLKTSTQVENVSLLLADNDGILKTRYSTGRNGNNLQGKELSTSSESVRMAIQTVDLQSSSKADVQLEEYWGEPVKSFMVCPLEEKGTVLGVLVLFNKKDSSQFTVKDIEFITRTENVLSKYYYFYESQNLFVTTLKKKNNVDELKDVSRSEFSFQLADLSGMIVRLYKKDPRAMEMISDHIKHLSDLLNSYI